ncbi:MAG: DUF1929 domain-containing protein [Methylocapsa sp.]|nr:DUF1929 domain-containing protein [Methylocapsa sp.]
MAVRDIYLKIEIIQGYSPVEPDDDVTPPIQYRRDCMRNIGHEDGIIPGDEVNARSLTALVYREYLDPNYLVPKPDKLVAADINEPSFDRRVPGTVIYARPGDRLRIHVKNTDAVPHSFHLHGLPHGIDSGGAWPFGAMSSDGRRSDEIDPGQTWTYSYEVTGETIGAWPFHDHYRNMGLSISRGLFGGLIVLPEDEYEALPKFPLPDGFLERSIEVASGLNLPENRPALAPHHAMQERALGDGRKPAIPPAASHAHRMDLDNTPDELVTYLATLDEYANAPHSLPPGGHLLHVPLFIHQMGGPRDLPVFQSGTLDPGQSFTSVFTLAAAYNYICGVHGASMSGSVTVEAGGPDNTSVAIGDFFFSPANVTVGIGGRVTWTNNGPGRHSIVEQGGESIPSYCLNGRSFSGNTPTVVARAGQKIRWHVFNLDAMGNWHNIYLHGQRWRLGGASIDTRSIGPGETFVTETEAPPVLLLPEGFKRCREAHKDAQPCDLRGDFLVGSGVETARTAGLAALLRSVETIHLTKEEAQQLESQTGLPRDSEDNACPAVQLDRFASAAAGQWELLDGRPGVTFMHAVLIPNSSRLLFWGYGPRPDQCRLWDQTTGLYTQPANQPFVFANDQNIWSGSHAHLNDPEGTILVHAGYYSNPRNPTLSPNTERRAFLFHPATNSFTHASDMNIGRFYPTTVTLEDGRALTLFGEDNAHTPGLPVQSLEIFAPGGGAGSWSTPKAVPATFKYFWYPWTFLLPDGDFFIAGPQVPARRFNWGANPIIDNPALQYNQVFGQRGVNMDGTAVLLPLKPPNYELRVMILGGLRAAVQQTAEWIDLSVTSPAWQALPNLNNPRDKVNAVLLPDGRVFVAGGITNFPGPVEIFDPEHPQAGFQLGPSMSITRNYHSAAILLPDGSVIMGGNPTAGQFTHNERYLPSYFFQPRPTITTVTPSPLVHGTPFTVQSPNAATISEVVFMRPGAVTHGFNHNQRYVGCVITSQTAAQVHAVAPPGLTYSPPGWHLLFIVDNNRVPSEGAWVRLT